MKMTGMEDAGDEADRIELDPGELNWAEQELAARYDELAGYLSSARELGGGLQDGTSPVTRPMGRAFGLRGGVGMGGVQVALQGYLTELAALREAIRQVRESHVNNEQQTAGVMRSQYEE
ncbi:hypothetical protein [Actinocrispum sp. NPDC049592]|uniref:hypothetical protein n=1 Tax=Actinocrispum sp. NPDC049592 TaxID=3154835 RepID=UPI0034401DD4